MKRFFRNLKSLAAVAMCGVAALAISCDNGTDTPEPHIHIERVDALESSLNNEVALLQALMEEGSVVGCEQDADGNWAVTLDSEEVITISCATGECALAVVEENGAYYWATLTNGQAVALVDGNGGKIAVAGNAQMWIGKDEEGDIYVSLDGGSNWTAVVGEVALFTNVAVEDNTATFTLSGGKSFEVALAPKFAVTVGEISCNVAGTVVYIPITITETVTQIKVAYINEGVDWTESWGGSPESAKEVFANAYYTQYGEWCPEFMQIEQLENNTIVVDNVPESGKLAHIFVMGIDAKSNTTPIVYKTYTPEGGIQMLYSDESGYDYGMPAVTYTGVVDEDYLSFSIEFTEGTDRVWINTLDKEYTGSRTPYELVELMTSGWMSTQEMTESGTYKRYYRNCMGSSDYPCALVYIWKDKNGKCHEAVLNYEVIEAAQNDIDALYNEEEGGVNPR